MFKTKSKQKPHKQNKIKTSKPINKTKSKQVNPINKTKSKQKPYKPTSFFGVGRCEAAHKSENGDFDKNKRKITNGNKIKTKSKQIKIKSKQNQNASDSLCKTPAVFSFKTPMAFACKIYAAPKQK